MSPEVVAALIGGVVGAVAVGLVTAYQDQAKANAKAKAAHKVYADIHKKWLAIANQPGAIQQRDCPILLEMLKEVLPMILEFGCAGTQKNFLSYLMAFRQHAIYVAGGQNGLASYTRDDLAKIMKEEVTNLESIGILTIFDTK